MYPRRKLTAVHGIKEECFGLPAYIFRAVLEEAHELVKFGSAVLDVVVQVRTRDLVFSAKLTEDYRVGVLNVQVKVILNSGLRIFSERKPDGLPHTTQGERLLHEESPKIVRL